MPHAKAPTEKEDNEDNGMRIHIKKNSLNNSRMSSR